MRQSHLRTAVISPQGLLLCFVTSLEIFISRIFNQPVSYWQGLRVDQGVVPGTSVLPRHCCALPLPL